MILLANLTLQPRPVSKQPFDKRISFRDRDSWVQGTYRKDQLILAGANKWETWSNTEKSGEGMTWSVLSYSPCCEAVRHLPCCALFWEKSHIVDRVPCIDLFPQMIRPDSMCPAPEEPPIGFVRDIGPVWAISFQTGQNLPLPCCISLVLPHAPLSTKKHRDLGLWAALDGCCSIFLDHWPAHISAIVASDR